MFNVECGFALSRFHIQHSTFNIQHSSFPLLLVESLIPTHDLPRHLPGPIPSHPVLAPFDNPKLRAGHEGVKPLTVGQRKMSVARAPHDADWRGDLLVEGSEPGE